MLCPPGSVQYRSSIKKAVFSQFTPLRPHDAVSARVAHHGTALQDVDPRATQANKQRRLVARGLDEDKENEVNRRQRDDLQPLDLVVKSVVKDCDAVCDDVSFNRHADDVDNKPSAGRVNDNLEQESAVKTSNSITAKR